MRFSLSSDVIAEVVAILGTLLLSVEKCRGAFLTVTLAVRRTHTTLLVCCYP